MLYFVADEILTLLYSYATRPPSEIPLRCYAGPSALVVRLHVRADGRVRAHRSQASRGEETYPTMKTTSTTRSSFLPTYHSPTQPHTMSLRTATRRSLQSLPRTVTGSATRSLIVPSQSLLSESTASPSSSSSSSSGKQGILSSFLRGSDSAKAEGQTTQSHSTSVARGKYIHEIQRHDVKSEHVEQYKQVM